MRCQGKKLEYDGATGRYRPGPRQDRTRLYLIAGIGGGSALLGLLLLVVALVMGANRPPVNDLADSDDKDKAGQTDKGGGADKDKQVPQ